MQTICVPLPTLLRHADIKVDLSYVVLRLSSYRSGRISFTPASYSIVSYNTPY